MQKKNLQIMDSHAHLTSEDFPMDYQAGIKRAKEASVVKIMNICTTPEELKKGLKLEQKYPQVIKNIACTTPHDAEADTKEVFAFFEKHALEKKLVGVGETGFDDFIEPDNQSYQKDVCRKYIDLGIRSDLPVVFHVRGDKAFENLFSAASEFDSFKGVIHCFTGNQEQMEKVLSFGWYISISGIVTFKKSQELRDTIKDLPLDRLLIETDSPWLAPQGYRGKPNEPAYISVIAEELSSVYDVSYEEICHRTYTNGNHLFSLDK